MGACGHGSPPQGFENGGVSLSTTSNGAEFHMPPSVKAGFYRVCWCPEEVLCIVSADYVIDIGALDVGGPDASMSYNCYEWQTCTFEFTGTALSNGDRIRV